MDAWNIYHKDGSVLCDVDGNQVIFTSLENTDVWMGECSVSITVKNDAPIIFSIGDYVIYRNERYEINYDPGKIKASSKNTYGEGFVYNDIKFNSLSDELVRAEFLDVVLFEGTVNVDGIETPLHYTALPKFSFYVEFIDDLLDRIQANMNEQYGDGVWKIFSTNMERSVVRGCSESDWHNAYGNESKYIAIDSQSITVDNSTCWDALSLVNSKWDITFIVRGRNVYVGINGPKAPHVFKYGKGNGLREIEQTVDSEQNVITRLRAYGSDKNMPQRYYAELGKKCFANVTKVDKSVSNFIEITTDLPYNSTLFNTPRTYKTSEDSETFTLGWAVKVTFDFQTVVTAHIEPTTTQDGCCIVHTELGEPYDTGDELDSVKLQKFIESASVGKKLYFTRGIYKSAFEKEFVEFDNNMPNNMAVNRLMLPGFPDTSLSAFWNTMTDEEKKYVNPTGSNIIFSEDKYRPYLDSPEKENAGLRQYSMYFVNDDKKNGIIEIYPTIEEMVVSGERIDEISVGSSIDDNGVFDDGQEVKDFYIKLKKQIDFDLNDVKNDDFSISLKDGMCGGRTFKINACTKESDGSWSLKCTRVKDDALELWFPYKDYPIRKGDHFVLTGLELPDSYIRAASIKLLKYSISYLNSNCKTRYAFQLKVDDLFMARQHDLSVSDSSGATKSLYKTLRAGDVMSIRDEDLGIDSDIVIEQLTIKEKEGNIPSYEITLRDDKSVGAITKIQDKIDSIYSAVGTGGTLNESQVESVVAKVAGKLFVTNDWFGRIFNIVDQYGNKQGENEGIAENSSIRAKMSLWSDGGISALGNSASSGGSGGGGLDAELLWSVLGNSGTEQISKSHLADALAGYATEEWVEGKGYLTNRDVYTKEEIDAKDWSSNKGTVTSVGLTMPTGFSVSGSPITEKGILAVGFASGYSLPTTAKQSNWDTVYNWYSGITGSDTDTIINKWGEIISFLDGIEDTATLSGIVNGINQSITAEANRAKAEERSLSKSITDEVSRAKAAEQTLTSSISTNTSAINVLKGYFTNGVAKSAVKLQTARKIWGNTFDGTQDVAGDLILPNGKKIVIGGASLSWDADNKSVKIDGSVYATGGVSALGNSDVAGGGGGGLMGSIVPYAKAIALTVQNEGAEIASAWSVKMLYDKIENVDVSGQLTSYLTKQEAQSLYQPIGNYLTAHQDISGKADRSELLGYLPLTGGTLTGNLNLGGNTLFAGDISIDAEEKNWNLPRKNSIKLLLCRDVPATGSPSTYISGVSILTNYVGFQLASYGGWKDELYFRKIEDNNTWHDWYRIYHEGFKPTKSDVGLGNVDNTADANKSVLYATTAGSANAANGVVCNLLHNAGSTVKSNKDAIVQYFNNNSGLGTNVAVSSFLIRNWDNDSATVISDSVYSFIKISGGYSTSKYAQYLLSSYGEKPVGVIGRSENTWGKFHWIAYKEDIPTKVSQLSNDSGYITSSGSCAYASTAGIANSVAWSNVSGRPTSMPASDVYAWAKAATKPNYTYDEIKVKGLVNVADFTRVVIALCEVTKSQAYTGTFSSGEILYYRTNGVIPIEYARVNFIDSYFLNYDAKYSLETSTENESKDKPISSIYASAGFRKCTFVYNGKHYAGVEAYLSQAASYYWRGYSHGHTVFGVIVEQNKAVMNEEIYNSLSYNGQNRSGISFGNVRADSFVKKDSSNSYVLLGGGGHALISSLSVATAAKLQTARTIWGQRFDGTSNVDGNLSCNGQGSFNSLQIGNITISYDAANKGLRIAGGGLYTDSYLSSLGVDASTALSVKKWADSIQITTESDAELATAYSIGNLYRLINSNQKSITQSLNQSVGALQGRCTSLEQRVSALEKKVN